MYSIIQNMKTYKQNLKGLSKEQFTMIKDMCKHSNSLYNSALYVINSYYEQTGQYIGYVKLYHEMKTNIHYSSMTAKIAQQIIRLVDKTYMSYFALLKQKRSGQYQDNVNKPKYKKPNQGFILILPSDQISVKNNKIKLTKDIRLNFTKEINGKIKQIIIKPNNHKHYTIYIQYDENKNEIIKLNEENKLGIDLGLNNLVSCASNIGPSFLMNGKPLKSYNQFYNKRKSKIMSELKICNDKYYSHKLANLDIKRNNYINNYFNQAINKIVKYCLEYNIGTIVMGYNETWKTNINIGKKNNQSFVNIPHFTLKQKLISKCDEYGINLIMVEESYTSKCSFIDNEIMEHQEKYIGRRVKRGLFRSKENILLNADINGACNIIRKVFPEFKYEGIEGFIVSPKVLNLN